MIRSRDVAFLEDQTIEDFEKAVEKLELFNDDLIDLDPPMVDDHAGEDVQEDHSDIGDDNTSRGNDELEVQNEHSEPPVPVALLW